MLGTTFQPPQTTSNTISAVKARHQFGRLLDKAYYRGENLLVERSGQPMAAIIPISVFNWMQSIKSQTKKDFFEMTDQLREDFSDLDEEEINNLVDEAVQATRSERTTLSNP